MRCVYSSEWVNSPALCFYRLSPWVNALRSGFPNSQFCFVFLSVIQSFLILILSLYFFSSSYFRFALLNSISLSLEYLCYVICEFGQEPITCIPFLLSSDSILPSPVLPSFLSILLLLLPLSFLILISSANSAIRFAKISFFVFFTWSIQCYIIVCDVSKKFYIRR